MKALLPECSYLSLKNYKDTPFEKNKASFKSYKKGRLVYPAVRRAAPP